MKTLNMTAFIRLKANGAGKPKRFQILAYSGGILSVDGFPNGVVVDLSGLETPGSIPILIDHEKTVEATLGLTDNIHNSGTSLSLAGTVTGQSVKAQGVIAQATAGHVWQASIGAMVVESEDIPAGVTATANGQTFVGPIVIARRSVLRETSVLPMGADSTTSVNLAASARRFLKGSAAMSFEDWLMSLGLDASTLTPEAAAVLQTAFSATQAPPAPPVAAAPVVPVAPPAMPPTAAAGVTALDIQATLAANRKQIAEQFRKSAEIQAKAAGYPMIAAKAIEDDWSIEKVELEVIKAAAAKGTRPTSFHSAEKNLPQGQVIEAALCISGKHKHTEKEFKPEILQAAHSAYRGRLGLQDVFIEAARANGWTGHSFKQAPKDCFRAAMGGAIEAGFTTISLPGILSNTANKFLLEGWMGVEDTWRQVSSTGSVSDFKAITSYRMGIDAKFEKVGPGGNIPHGELSEESYTNQAETYGKMYVITRQMLINDDLGALTKIPQGLGRGAALELNTVFWTEFMADAATFFPTDASLGNYMEGAATALSVASLTQGELLFLNQTDPDGEPLGVEPQILLVPNALNVTAASLMNDTEYRDTTASTKFTTGNPHRGKFTPVRSSYLSNSTITGYSTTAWYLLANPSDVSMIEVVFLNGQQTPTIEDADADFNTLGVQMRGYFDFGVNKQEYRAAIKSKGAA